MLSGRTPNGLLTQTILEKVGYYPTYKILFDLITAALISKLRVGLAHLSAVPNGRNRPPHSVRCGWSRRFPCSRINQLLDQTSVHDAAWHKSTVFHPPQRMEVWFFLLSDQPFARRTCVVELIQHLACGLPVAIPPVGVNKEPLKPIVGCLLASNEDHWAEAVGPMDAVPGLGLRLMQTGEPRVEASYSQQVHVEAQPVLEVLNRILSGAKG